ncbi:MAG TPA: hypothetical protein VJJ72_01135 [Candidatus Paceibacterota bacterium]
MKVNFLHSGLKLLGFTNFGDPIHGTQGESIEQFLEQSISLNWLERLWLRTLGNDLVIGSFRTILNSGKPSGPIVYRVFIHRGCGKLRASYYQGHEQDLSCWKCKKKDQESPVHVPALNLHQV